MVDNMASEYGWTMEYIENLTYIRIKRLLQAIEKRKEQEEYLQRLHIGLQATAIVKAIGAAFDKKEIYIDDLIGKAPGYKIEESETIEEWKENAKNNGLKIQK